MMKSNHRVLWKNEFVGRGVFSVTDMRRDKDLSQSKGRKQRDDGSDSRGQVSVSIWFEVGTCEQAQSVRLSSCTPLTSRTSVRFD